MKTPETVRANDEALTAMYRQDVGRMTPEEEKIYRDLVAEQQEAHRAITTIEVKGADGVETPITVNSIGNTALHNFHVVHAAGRWNRDE